VKADYERQAAELADVSVWLNVERAGFLNGIYKGFSRQPPLQSIKVSKR